METGDELLPGEPERGRFRRRRRRRERRGRPRGLYLLPHLVTTTGLFFGF